MNNFWVCYGEYHGKRTITAFSRYARHKSQLLEENAVYRLYMTAAARCVVSAWGDVKMPDYAELINLKEPDNRTGDEIAAEVIKNAGLEVVSA